MSGRCLVLVVALALAAPAARADAVPERADRVLGLARVWANAKFFHPYLAYKDLDWDAALVAALPKVEAATTVADYRAAIQQMLARLGDPVTRVIDAPPGPVPGAPRTDFVRWPAPNILEVDLGAITGSGWDYVAFGAKGKQLATEAAKARVVIVDLRGPFAELDGVVLDNFADALPAIEDWPLQRTVQHHGYRTQHGRTSGGYYSTFITTGGRPAKPAPKTGPAHVVFVADGKTPIPEIALALQASGRATIVASAVLPEDTAVQTDTLELPGGVTVQLRLGELLWGPPAADVRAADPLARARALAPAIASKPAKRRAVLALPPLRDRDDADYPAPELPARELRVLAGIKAWAVIDRFEPYRYLIPDWDRALRDALPRLEAAADRDAYVDALKVLGARIGDGHVNLFPAVKSTMKPRGLPAFETRLVEGKLAVIRTVDPAATKALGLAAGDVIDTIDGKPALEALAGKRATITGSTDESRDQRIAGSLLAGEDGTTVALGIRGADGKPRKVTAPRTAAFAAAMWAPATTPHWKKLRPDVGYVDLTLLTVPEVDAMFAELGATRAIVFDMRGYPNGTAWSLAPRVNTRGAKYGAQFLQPLASGGNGGTNVADERVRFLQPIPPLPAGASVYRGKVIVLIDDRAISQAEHTCLFLQETAGATFVGSPTHGANGDVTVMRLPGGLRMSFTGQEVRHVDGKQLQKVGIQPHVLVRPTLAGVRAGKDEVLARALAWLDKKSP